MEDDGKEHNPGCEAFWHKFYDSDDGQLSVKEWANRGADEIKEGGKLMDHYEWFMQYEQYEEDLMNCLSMLFSRLECPRRVLHVGCGNSDFCDHFPTSLTTAFFNTGRVLEPIILNIDICDNIIKHLVSVFPQRLYAVGNCCSLVKSSATVFNAEWYHHSGSPPFLEAVRERSVDLVFDKGTADALLSAFAGEYNPNMEAYAQEVLEVLRAGGVFFTISINAADVLNSYFLSAATTCGNYFSLQYTATIKLESAEQKCLRVETLGRRYNCYGYKVLSDN